MTINNMELVNKIRELGSVGFQKNIGTTRVAFSDSFVDGRTLVKKYMDEAGLVIEVDAVGNLIGRLPGKIDKVISIGSHIDTVPGGGMYDGAYGVLAGIEMVRTLKDFGYTNNHTIEIIAFNEEEGNAVGGTFGSKAVAGVSQEAATLEKCGSFGIGTDEIERSRRKADEYKCYLELHIEQGGILENKALNIGIVEGIVGIVRYMVTVNGFANHAGSTPMNLRNDAMEKAAKIICRAMDLAREIDPNMTCTVGYLNTEPGAVNVIPGKVVFPIEFRTMKTDNIIRLVEILNNEFSAFGVEFSQFLWQDETIMDEHLQNVIRDSCEDLDMKYMTMPSGAGHDAINMALFTKTAMIFIPSVGGISHNIKEYSADKAVEDGADVLLKTFCRLDAED